MRPTRLLLITVVATGLAVAAPQLATSSDQAQARAMPMAAPGAPAPASPPAPLTDTYPDFSLPAVLSCGDFDFVALDSVQQMQRLTAFPQLNCALTRLDNSVGRVVCYPQADLVVFGLPVSQFSLFDHGDERELQVLFAAPKTRLVEQVEKFYGRTSLPYADGGGILGFAGKQGDCRSLVSRDHGDGAALSCRVQAPVFCPSPPADAVTTAAWLAQTSGSISGQILDPQASAGFSTHVCAVSSRGGYTSCRSLPTGQAQYRIDDLFAGYYQVVALVVGGNGETHYGGYSESVECLRKGASACNDGRLREVPVHDGEAVSHIDVLDFRNRNASWPDAYDVGD